MDNSLFGLLRSKDIIAILDGDTDFGDYTFDDGRKIKIGLPYQSGKELCDISTRFGLTKIYTWNGVNQSRWQYVDELLEYCINKGRCSDLLSFCFLSGHNKGHVHIESSGAEIEIDIQNFQVLNAAVRFLNIR